MVRLEPQLFAEAYSRLKKMTARFRLYVPTFDDLEVSVIKGFYNDVVYFELYVDIYHVYLPISLILQIIYDTTDGMPDIEIQDEGQEPMQAGQPVAIEHVYVKKTLEAS